jgi:hypothetical protein
MDELITTTSSRAQEATKAMNSAARGGNDADGLTHFTKRVGSHVNDVAIDTSAALVRSRVISDDGGQVTRQAFQYAHASTGLSVRVKTDYQLSGGQFNGRHTLTLSNVVIDGQAVNP